MHYSLKNTINSLILLGAISVVPGYVKAQEASSLFDNEEEVSVSLKDSTSETKDISLDIDVNVPSESALISPKVAETKAPDSQDTETIPMDFEQDSEESFDMGDNLEDAQDDATTPETDEPAVEQSADSSKEVAPEPKEPETVSSLSENIDKELFAKMSDLERQTTILNLELKKERIANEVAAVKAQRRKAQEEEKRRLEEEERKKQEWQNEQDRLMVEEQRKLKEVEMALEKLRQEKIVKAYKETMLATTQEWIKKNAEIYKELAEKDETIKNIMKDYADRMGILFQKSDDIKTKSEAARVNYDKKVANLEGQIAILKTRLEAEIEKSNQLASGGTLRKNPFAGEDISGAVSPEKVRLSLEYAIMEITGQGDDLSAKLITTEGDVFMVKVGTTLRNGYTVDEITKTFLSAVKDDDTDYLYFSAGGILDREPVKPLELSEEVAATTFAKPNNNQKNAGPVSTKGVPSLGRGMIVK